jgi:hypothetical protein
MRNLKYVRTAEMPRRIDAGALQRHHREHGGIAGGTDRHRLARTDPRRAPHQPVAFDARFLGVGAQMRLAETPAVEDDLIARFPARMRRGAHRAGEIHAGDHGKPPHHRRLAGNR